jgi:hypothetical protein
MGAEPTAVPTRLWRRRVNSQGWLWLLAAIPALYAGLLILNRKAVAQHEGTGDPNQGIIVFVEPVRWLFIIWGFASFARGLRQAGGQQQLQLFRWSNRAGALLVLPDLMRRRRLRAKASRLARYLNELAVRNPGCAIHLCGYSSGCYLIAEAAPHLSVSVNLGTVVLLAATISPDYPLSHLHERARKIHHFYSPLDFVINGAGPWLFGCNDRRRAPACGMVGFNTDLANVVQHCWSPADMRRGYFGDHFTVTAGSFIGKRVAPLFQPEQCDGSSREC